MAGAEEEYQKLVLALADGEEVVAGQMFGKPCLKVGGKAFLARHGEVVVFKLGSPHHEKAMAIKGASLWDPSGKGRPMKEWVAVPAAGSKSFAALTKAALAYVSGA